MTMCKKTAVGGVAHRPDFLGIKLRNRALGRIPPRPPVTGDVDAEAEPHPVVGEHVVDEAPQRGEAVLVFYHVF